MSHLRRRVSGTLPPRVAALTLGASLVLAGCSDGDAAGGDDPPTSSSPSSSSTSPATEPSSTDEPSVMPASGPKLALEDVELRMPEGWHLDDDDVSFLVIGMADDRSATIALTSFPALNPDVSVAQLARITVRNAGYPPGSIQPETTMAGLPAFHVAGRVVGEDAEEIGVMHDGNIVAVKFNFIRGPVKGRQELIDSVISTVKLR
jgi:hypothetical protein